MGMTRHTVENSLDWISYLLTVIHERAHEDADDREPVRELHITQYTCFRQPLNEVVD
jgi:hypothetical protein